MEEDKKLYPMRFCSLQDEYPWGTETFKIADLGYRDSLVRDGWLAGNSISELMDTYMDRVTGGTAYDFYGRQFPVCIRHLKIKGKLPLQVHPDDEIAAQRYDFLGKEKLWYVLRAGKDAGLAIGFRDGSDASEVFARCNDGSIGDILNIIAPHAGQSIRIAPGTPHTAFGDIELLEIAESSPLDFCLHGWGQEVPEEAFDPALSLVDSLDFINYTRYSSDCGKGDALADIPQFTVRRIGLTTPLRVKGNGSDEFVLYSCIGGGASVQIDVFGSKAVFGFSAGETILVPAECTDFDLLPAERDTILIETMVHRHEEDSYIDPSAEAELPEGN